MNRDEFHKLFKAPGPAVLPVVHAQDSGQAERNVRIALSEGAQGCLLINHDFEYPQFLPIVRHVRAMFPRAWLGVNFLGVTGADAFPVLGELARDGVAVDAYWADDACIDERAPANAQEDAAAITKARTESGWQGLYFGGTAFKKQREVNPEDYETSARLAAGHMDAVTTSGVATGDAAGTDKITALRRGCGDAPLALASGVTPENALDYARDVDCFLVATGINVNGDFYNIDPVRLRSLLAVCRRAGAPAPALSTGDRWYLNRMAPNVKGGMFAWLDPSSIYVNARAFHALVDDLVAPFNSSGVDVVAGFDAMGFVLGTAIATRLGTGFLTIRKSGKLPVPSDSVDFVNYSGRQQQLEMRMPAFAPGTRVLLVDQWIETGGTMQAGIRLVESQGGIVAGIAAVCLEESERTAHFRQRYRCSTAVLPETDIQAQCNRQTLDSFASFQPESTFPDIDR